MKGVNRHFVFRNYGWIAIVAGGIASVSLFFHGGEEKVGLIGACVAGLLGFCYFAQQQKLAETSLFHALFTQFNARYDKLNGRLAAMTGVGTGITQEERNVVVDYFNLCAEEYVFYQEGYIPDHVWKAWCRGMTWYLRRHPYKDIWNEEVNTDSFYGLTEEIILEGAE